MKNDILRLLTKREIIQIDVMKLKLASLSFSNVIKSINLLLIKFKTGFTLIYRKITWFSDTENLIY